MTDNIRPALYQAVYNAVIANKADAKKEDTVTICGKCCESGDVLIRDLKTVKPEAAMCLPYFQQALTVIQWQAIIIKIRFRRLSCKGWQ